MCFYIYINGSWKDFVEETNIWMLCQIIERKLIYFKLFKFIFKVYVEIKKNFISY